MICLLACYFGRFVSRVALRCCASLFRSVVFVSGFVSVACLLFVLIGVGAFHGFCGLLDFVVLVVA